MKFGLSDDLAKKIVENVMQVVSYNINVMNNEGIIIASGDKQRVGMLHQGALKAINKNGLHEVHQATITDRMGVNLPFKYRDEVVGVIGISGDPDEVRALVYVIKAIAELMIDQQYIINSDLRKKFDFENFLREWCDTPRDGYSEDFRARAEEFGVDLEWKRVCVAIEAERSQSSLKDSVSACLGQNEYLLRYREKLLLILNDVKAKGEVENLEKRLRQMYDGLPDIQGVGVGVRTSDVFRSCHTAHKGLLYARRMGDMERGRIAYFDEYWCQDVISQYDRKNVFENVITNLEKQDQTGELLNTFLSYFDCDGNIYDITEKLHIHRNTLNYRLQKIEELTKRSFRKFGDKFFLYNAYVIYRLR